MDMTPVMRFQVANDSINLVKNPNGERGAFFYTTPVTNTLLTSTDIRTNLVTNPSFETNTTGWTDTFGWGTTIARDTVTPYSGTYSMKLTNGSTSRYLAGTGNIAISASGTYTFSVYLRSSIARQARVTINWYDSGNASKGGTFNQSNTATTWQRHAVTVTAPADAAYARVSVEFIGNASGESHWVDAALLELADTAGSYFDGSTGGTWTGTAHASATVMEVTGSGTGDKLTFKTNVSQPSYFFVNKMPISAGQYASSRFDIVKITASHNVKIQYEWLDINDALLSTSTLSGALSTIGTNIGPTSLAPANTAWFKMKIWLENGSTAASANASVTFNKVMAKVTPTGSATSQRTNIVGNPSFQVDTSGWFEANDSTTLGRTTTKAYVGTAAGTLRRDGSAGWTTARTVSYGVTAKKTYTASAYVSEHTGGVGDAVIAIQWMTASNKVISLSAGTKVNPGSGWSRITVTATAPGNAYYAQVIIKNYSGTGNIMAFDGVLFELAGTVGDYFDGTTTDTSQIVYDWTGTAHNSRSTATSTSTYFDYVDPWDWRDILGTTSNITIDRGGLDTGTLTATIIDPTLDPVDSEILEEGKTVRLQVLKDTGVWVNRFEGQIDSLKTNYPADLKAFAEVSIKTIIELTAIDNTSNLAGHKFTDANGKSIGVSVAHIPGIIEGASVPWLVNGFNSQVTSITKLSVSDDASALDQIAVARDSERGYAFVNKDNVLVAVDSAHIDNTVKATLTDTNIQGDIQDGTAWATSGWGVYNIYDYNAGASFSLQTGSGLDAYDTFYRVTSATSDDLGFRLTPNPEMVPTIEGDTFVLNGWVRYTNNTNNNGLSIYATQKVNTDAVPSESDPIVLQDGVWQQIRIQLPTVTGASAASVESFLFAYLVNGGDYIDLTGFYVEQIGNRIPSYRDAVVASSTDDIVNSVTVNKLSNNANDTQPVAYGPYTDTDSIAKYGEVVGEYPYQGTLAGVNAFAQSILDAAAWPVRRMESLVFPVYRDTLSWDYGCDLDLYDVVHVKYADKIDADHRITSISESFTVDADGHRWEITFGFATVSGVATPRTTGGTGKTTTKSTLAAVMQTNAQSIPANSTTAVNWNTTVTTNPEMTTSSSGITVNQEGFYRITGQVGLENSGTTGVIQVAILVNGSTARVLHRGPYAGSLTTVSGQAVVSLFAGDIVTLGVVQNNGGTRTLVGGTSNATTMEVEPV